jgi:hypothetical protein
MKLSNSSRSGHPRLSEGGVTVVHEREGPVLVSLLLSMEGRIRVPVSVEKRTPIKTSNQKKRYNTHGGILFRWKVKGNAG